MIKLIRDYYIDGNTGDFVLKLDTGKDDKDGKRIYSTIGYHGTVDACIRGLYRVLCRKLVAEEALTLKEAEKRFQDIVNELRVIMPNCFK